MKPMIIALAGRKYSGKDTVMRLLEEMLPENEWQVVLTSPVVVRIYCERTGYSPEEVLRNKEKHREALQKIGEEEDIDILVEALGEAFVDRKIIFNSVRRQSECQFFEEFDTVFILVTANKETRKKRAGCELMGEDDPTEYEAVEYLTDHKNCFVVNNDSEEDGYLKYRVKEVVHALCGD